MGIPGGRLTIALVGVAAVLGAPAAYIAVAYLDTARVEQITPGNGAVLNTRSPRIVLGVENPGGLSDLRVVVDGAAQSTAPARIAHGFVVQGLALDDGPHRIHLDARTGGLFGGRVARDLTVTIDTAKPQLSLDPAPRRWQTTPTFSGRGEPGTTLTAIWRAGRASMTIPAGGRFTIEPKIAGGYTPVTLEARDAAGNVARARRVLRLDDTPPAIAPPTWPQWETKTDTPTLILAVKDLSRVRYRVSLDGLDQTARTTKAGMRYVPGRLAQGMHHLVVTAVDAAGNRSTMQRDLGVDSTDVLTSDLTLTVGARGADVRSLTRRLKLDGKWRGRPLTHYTWRVKQQVAAWQRAHAMAPDGVAHPALLAKTYGKIVIVKHLFRLYAYRDGKLVLTFPVAVGQPAYPSPTGSFQVIEKLRNPTWIPPNSPWAKGLEPIPPGSGNPLGPRWIGTSAPAVGIHGTPQDWSIGTAASHGCIRMHIPDVKRLFERVQVGEAVDFYA